MTAASSKKLAAALRTAGFEALARRADLDEFHDFQSPHDLPSMALDVELVAIIMSPLYSQQNKDRAKVIRRRHHDGEFDATRKESEAWAMSAEAQAVFQSFVERHAKSG